MWLQLHGRIENRVRITNGTATVSVEVLCRTKVSHWGIPRRRTESRKRKSGELLELSASMNLQVRIPVVFVVGKRPQHPYGCCGFLFANFFSIFIFRKTLCIPGSFADPLQILDFSICDFIGETIPLRYPVRIRNDRPFLCLGDAISQKSNRIFWFYHALFGRV